MDYVEFKMFQISSFSEIKEFAECKNKIKK